MSHKLNNQIVPYLLRSLVNDPSVDWFLRHGHAIALSAVLHDAPAKVLACGLYDVITDAAVTHASSDRVSQSTV